MNQQPATLRRDIWRYHSIHGTRVALQVETSTDTVCEFIVLDALLPEEIESKLRMAIVGRSHAFVSRFFDRLNAEPIVG